LAATEAPNHVAAIGGDCAWIAGGGRDADELARYATIERLPDPNLVMVVLQVEPWLQ